MGRAALREVTTRRPGCLRTGAALTPGRRSLAVTRLARLAGRRVDRRQRALTLPVTKVPRTSFALKATAATATIAACIRCSRVKVPVATSTTRTFVGKRGERALTGPVIEDARLDTILGLTVANFVSYPTPCTYIRVETTYAAQQRSHGCSCPGTGYH